MFPSVKKLSSLLRKLVLLMAVGPLLTACGAKDTYLLVHGAFQDQRVWENVKGQLEKEGHTVVTLDLPSHGSDATAFSEVSLQSYTDRVTQAIDAQPEPVILVGHSMGGIVIASASEARPDKIKKAVYVAAYLLKDGETMLQAAETDKESQVGANLIFENNGATARINPDKVVDIFCADCPEDQKARMRASSPSEPLAPMTQPVKVTDASFGRVPRVYIETTKDLAVGNALQKRMYTETPVEQVLTMDTGHSPFLSQPETLAKHLLSL